MNYEMKYDQEEEYSETCFDEEADKRENMLLDLVINQTAFWNN